MSTLLTNKFRFEFVTNQYKAWINMVGDCYVTSAENHYSYLLSTKEEFDLTLQQILAYDKDQRSKRKKYSAIL